MRIAALLFTLFFALFVAGCASQQKFTEARDSWIGASYEEVVRAWGTPARNAKFADGDAYTWVSQETVSRGNVFPSIGVFGGSGGGVGVGTGVTFGGGGRSEIRQCERTLIFKGGRVVEQNWQGPEDFCRTFGRTAGR
jgi:hypothetical protein